MTTTILTYYCSGMYYAKFGKYAATDALSASNADDGAAHSFSAFQNFSFQLLIYDR